LSLGQTELLSIKVDLFYADLRGQYGRLGYTEIAISRATARALAMYLVDRCLLVTVRILLAHLYLERYEDRLVSWLLGGRKLDRSQTAGAVSAHGSRDQICIIFLPKILNCLVLAPLEKFLPILMRIKCLFEGEQAGEALVHLVLPPEYLPATVVDLDLVLKSDVVVVVVVMV